MLLIRSAHPLRPTLLVMAPAPAAVGAHAAPHQRTHTASKRHTAGLRTLPATSTQQVSSSRSGTRTAPAPMAPSALSPAEVDNLLRPLLLKDLRIQCRVRGLSPAGGLEALRDRLKEVWARQLDRSLPPPAQAARPHAPSRCAAAAVAAHADVGRLRAQAGGRERPGHRSSDRRPLLGGAGVWQAAEQLPEARGPGESRC